MVGRTVRTGRAPIRRLPPAARPRPRPARQRGGLPHDTAYPPTAAWDDLAGALGARDATPPTSPLRWSQPAGCILRYGLDSRSTLRAVPAAGAASDSTSFPKGGPTGVYNTSTVDWSSSDGKRAHIAMRPMKAGLLVGDLRTPPGEVPPPPAFDLELGAPQLRAPSGETGWGNLGSERGLASFWPDLPAAVAPGSHATTVLPWAPTGAAQGKVPALEEQVTVELVRWIEVGGVRAAVLDAWSTTKLPDLLGGMDMPLPSSVTRPSMAGVQEMRARYVVLASGRLLHARVHDQVDTTITVGGGTTSRQLATKRAEVRLLAACDGPVVAPFPDASKPGELAMVAVGELQRAVHEKDLPRATLAFAPAVLARHGKLAVEKTLREHVARYQAGSVGAATTPAMFSAWPARERIAPDPEKFRGFGAVASTREDHGVDEATRGLVEARSEGSGGNGHRFGGARRRRWIGLRAVAAGAPSALRRGVGNAAACSRPSGEARGRSRTPPSDRASARCPASRWRASPPPRRPRSPGPACRRASRTSRLRGGPGLDLLHPAHTQRGKLDLDQPHPVVEVLAEAGWSQPLPWSTVRRR